MARHKPIVVVGSLNIDLVVRTARLPRPGETVRGDQFYTAPGGKGANQAVAAARMAGPDLDVIMIGRVGQDEFGRVLRQSLAEAGAVVDHVEAVAGPSGNAMISVEASGQNCIIITAGANGRLTVEDMNRVASTLRGADTLLLQLEVPLPVVERAAELAASGGARVVLNPAPAPDGALPRTLLQHVAILVPNETEAEALTGTTDQHAAAETLRSWGVQTVIITLGERGALVATPAGSEIIQAFDVTAVDTTAAGDAFLGALAVALAEGKDLFHALRFASAAGALTCTIPGAQPALPWRSTVDSFLLGE
ncbi:MAG TPA: ribokinase [Ardenticatenaceae bacterium]|nr:ribokinase [Ardenticatenaceae bacterium]